MPDGAAMTTALRRHLSHDAVRAARSHLRSVRSELRHALPDPGPGRIRRVDGCLLRLEDRDRREDAVPRVDGPVPLEPRLVAERGRELRDRTPRHLSGVLDALVPPNDRVHVLLLET